MPTTQVPLQNHVILSAGFNMSPLAQKERGIFYFFKIKSEFQFSGKKSTSKEINNIMRQILFHIVKLD